jgi:deoxyuridine 5'-triphosphate nucleotidohydrolase
LKKQYGTLIIIVFQEGSRGVFDYTMSANMSMEMDVPHPSHHNTLSFAFMKTDPVAVAPNKAHETDSGFDLVLIKKVKEVGNVQFFSTGIAVQPPTGYYFELVGRSSISKSGYMLANNIGIIDEDYRGDIIAALIKVDPNAPELTLPNRLVQLIPRKRVDMNVEEKTELVDTVRGDGGFGSTNK